MKKLTQKNLDIYNFLREFQKENGYCPSYREMQDNTNYKSICSIKHAVDKLEDMGMLTTVRDKNGNILARTIKTVCNNHTKELIEECRKNI